MKRTMKTRLRTGSIALVLALLSQMNAQQTRRPQPSPADAKTAGDTKSLEGDLRPDGKGGADHRRPRLKKVPIGRAIPGPNGKAVTTGNGIDYHGGPVMQGNPVNVYVIYYGNWDGGAAPSDSLDSVNLIDTFINNIGCTGYERINTTYGDTTGDVSGNVTLAGVAFDSYSQGTDLNSGVSNVVSGAISNGSLPLDPDGLYFVLSSSDVDESEGFCNAFCGFHTSGPINGTNLRFSFVGNSDRCLGSCGAQSITPNLNTGADSMVSVIAHEMEEAISDPDVNAWFDNSGEENGDKCAWNFGPTQFDGNGAQFNQTFGGFNWLIQMNWENDNGGGCSQNLGGPFF